MDVFERQWAIGKGASHGSRVEARSDIRVRPARLFALRPGGGYKLLDVLRRE
jgi:hypothetical protein